MELNNLINFNNNNFIIKLQLTENKQAFGYISVIFSNVFEHVFIFSLKKRKRKQIIVFLSIFL